MTNNTQPIIITTHSEEQTIAFAASLTQIIRPPAVIALFGDLGSGKTRFVRGLAKGLSLNENQVSSPTFVIMHEYQPDNTSAISPIIIHIDAYRLSGLDDLQTIGWDELLRKPDAVIVIEWAERIKEALPDIRIDILLQHTGATDRLITITPVGRKLEYIPDMPEIPTVPNTTNKQTKHSPTRKHSCPICKKNASIDSPSFPFCSKRCRLLDLSNWLNGEYTLGRTITPEDESDIK